tara:strand:- start:213 stop:545 length:333 start_codon:yes stop_codon:yes gene_type:complete
MSWESILKSNIGCNSAALVGLARVLSQLIDLIPDTTERERMYIQMLSDFEENFGLNPENKTDQDVENAFDYTSDICYDLDRIGIIGADTLADMLGQIGTLSDEYNRCKRT